MVWGDPMNAADALREAMARELDVPPSSIVDAEVKWDAGGMETDPTYGDEHHTAPTFTVLVTFDNADGLRRERELSTEYTLTALLRAMLAASEPPKPRVNPFVEQTECDMFGHQWYRNTTTHRDVCRRCGETR
jgi:hypothetical protein